MKRKILILFSAAFLILSFFFLGIQNTQAIRLDTGRSTIQGYVFFDRNLNGVLEYSSEYPGISGVRVALLDSRGRFVAIETTDFKGYYQFYNIRGGNYKVKVLLSSRAHRFTNFSQRFVSLPEHTLTTISFGVKFR